MFQAACCLIAIDEPGDRNRTVEPHVLGAAI